MDFAVLSSLCAFLGNSRPGQRPQGAFFSEEVFGDLEATRLPDSPYTHTVLPTAQALEEFHWLTTARSSGLKHPYCAS